MKEIYAKEKTKKKKRKRKRKKKEKEGEKRTHLTSCVQSKHTIADLMASKRKEAF
jgi:hypothetical protein